MDSPDFGLSGDPSLTPNDDLDELSKLDREGPSLDVTDQLGISLYIKISIPL
jgi:hypothetical protein